MKRSIIDRYMIKNLLVQRPDDMHKGQAGRVLIIAGSRGMAGAAVLAARGALKSGAGIVKCAVPDELFNILQISVPEAMCISRAALLDDSFNLEEFDAIAVGPGLGVSTENYELISKLLHEYKGRLIIDADGLNTIARYGVSELKERVNETIITPHPGEADRILKASGLDGYDKEKRIECAEALCKATGAVTLLKGNETVITDGADVLINTTGNPGMATGGSGDVLTGIITGLAGASYLGLNALSATAAGAFIHGLAGDIAAEDKGQIGMTSADIAECIPYAYKVTI